MKEKFNVIVQELKNHNIFNNYWNDDIITELQSSVELMFEPTEYIGCYKNEKNFILNYIGCLDELKGSTARLDLIFTSTNSIFNLEKAQQASTTQKEIHAINAFVKVYNSEKKMIYSNNFTLWSKTPEEISGFSDTIKLFV